jgi:ParB family chromosome partitioning protein
MMMQTENPPPEETAGEATAGEAAEGFLLVSPDLIDVGPQVRTDIDPEGESLHALAETIRRLGVIQPLTVCPSGDRYFLVIGERRLLAARIAGLSTVPVRVIPTLQSRDDALELQLIENLQRADLNPIDTARALLEFYKSRHGDVTVDDVVNQCITHERDPERLDGAIAETVSAIGTITGKSIRSVQKMLAFLKLPDELRDALKDGRLSLTQGYLFSDYPDNPDLLRIFNDLLTTPVANDKLKAQLEAYRKTAAPRKAPEFRPFREIHTSIKHVGATIDDRNVLVAKDDLQQLLDALNLLASRVQSRIREIAPDEPPA